MVENGLSLIGNRLEELTLVQLSQSGADSYNLSVSLLKICHGQYASES